MVLELDLDYRELFTIHFLPQNTKINSFIQSSKYNLHGSIRESKVNGTLESKSQRREFEGMEKSIHRPLIFIRGM